jgi:predicted TIM-barrel fold metal-dependent hydrolase
MGRGGFKVFDSDMHIMEPPDLWQRYIDPAYAARAPRGILSENVRDLRMQWPDEPPMTVRSPHRGRNFERNQRTYAEHARRGWGPDVQVEAMDVEGIDVAVMFPSRGLSTLTWPNMDPKFAAAMARAYNDWLHEFCSYAPNRMYGAGMLSMHDIGSAVEEAYRVVEEFGFKAVFMRANIVTGKPWHDPYYEPLWTALEKLEIPVGLHEAIASRSRQIGDTFGANVGLQRIYAQPMEQMLAVGMFTAGGVLARHPKLRVAFLEANCSWVPWLLWRIDEDYELEGDLFMDELEMEPSAYFRRQCFVSVEPDEHPAKHMLEDFGSEQMVFSTDYPHGDSRYPRAVESFLELEIPDDDKRKILWDNCARFYSVKDTVIA